MYFYGGVVVSKKVLGKDKFGVQKVVRKGDYFWRFNGQFANF